MIDEPIDCKVWSLGSPGSQDSARKWHSYMVGMRWLSYIQASDSSPKSSKDCITQYLIPLISFVTVIALLVVNHCQGSYSASTRSTPERTGLAPPPSIVRCMSRASLMLTSPSALVRLR